MSLYRLLSRIATAPADLFLAPRPAAALAGVAPGPSSAAFDAAPEAARMEAASAGPLAAPVIPSAAGRPARPTQGRATGTATPRAPTFAAERTRDTSRETSQDMAREIFPEASATLPSAGSAADTSVVPSAGETAPPVRQPGDETAAELLRIAGVVWLIGAATVLLTVYGIAWIGRLMATGTIAQPGELPIGLLGFCLLTGPGAALLALAAWLPPRR